MGMTYTFQIQYEGGQSSTEKVRQSELEELGFAQAMGIKLAWKRIIDRLFATDKIETVNSIELTAFEKE